MINAQAYSKHTSYPTPPGKIVSKQTQKVLETSRKNSRDPLHENVDIITIELYT